MSVGIEQVSVILTVYQNPTVSQTVIASLGQKDKSGITKMLDSLERDAVARGLDKIAERADGLLAP